MSTNTDTQTTVKSTCYMCYNACGIIVHKQGDKLVNIEGDPVEVSGTHLRAMKDAGEITLYPSTYRIVYDHDD